MPRETRNDAEPQERRRRKNLDALQELKLAIPDAVKEKYPDHTFRWINDAGNRMHHKTQLDDWDKCDEVPALPVGTDQAGKPIYAHLCRKLKEFWEEDQRTAKAARKALEATIARTGKSDAQDDRTAAETYVPDGNSITHGAFTP